MGNLFLCSCTKCATPGEAPRGSTTNVQFSFSWWLRSFARPTALDRVSKSALTCVNTTNHSGWAGRGSRRRRRHRRRPRSRLGESPGRRDVVMARGVCASMCAALPLRSPGPAPSFSIAQQWTDSSHPRSEQPRKRRTRERRARASCPSAPPVDSAGGATDNNNVPASVGGV